MDTFVRWRLVDFCSVPQKLNCVTETAHTLTVLVETGLGRAEVRLMKMGNVFDTFEDARQGRLRRLNELISETIEMKEPA